MSLSRRIQSLAVSDLKPLRFILGILSLSFCTGLLFANADAGAYDLMLHLSSIKFWVLGFTVYSALKIYSCVAQKPEPSAILSSILGMWLWCYTLVSFVSNPIRAIGSADLMLVTVLIAEVWTISESIVNYRMNKYHV